MGSLELNYSRNDIDGTNYYGLTKGELEKFNPAVLDLGDISQDGKYFEALAASLI